MSLLSLLFQKKIPFLFHPITNKFSKTKRIDKGGEKHFGRKLQVCVGGVCVLIFRSLFVGGRDGWGKEMISSPPFYDPPFSPQHPHKVHIWEGVEPGVKNGALQIQKAVQRSALGVMYCGGKLF